MPLFNQTFSDDKPIYYPSNWESGKTGLELFQQFKLTWIFWFIKNALEAALACLWIFLLYTILMAAKEMLRLYKLEQSHINRIQNRKYIQRDFLLSSGFVAAVIIAMTTIFLYNNEMRNALLKGLIVFGVCLLAFSFKKTFRNSINKNSKKQ